MEGVGIYRIDIGEHRYFGRTIDLKRRSKTHLRELKRGSHRNIILQRAYNKYRYVNFSVVGTCEKQDLPYFEQIFIDNTKNVNISDASAGAGFGRANPMWGKKHTQATRNKISASNSGRSRSKEVREKISLATSGCKNHFYGKKHSEESKTKMSKSTKGVYVGSKSPLYDQTIYKFVKGDFFENCTAYELTAKYDLDRSSVTKLVKEKIKHHKGWRLIND